MRLILTRPRTLVAAVALVGEIEAATRDGRIDREAKARMLGRFWWLVRVVRGG